MFIFDLVREGIDGLAALLLRRRTTQQRKRLRAIQTLWPNLPPTRDRVSSNLDSEFYNLHAPRSKFWSTRHGPVRFL